MTDNVVSLNRGGVNSLAAHVFEGATIRIVNIDGKLWFVGRDVAAALGYTNPPEAIRTHCKRAQPLENIRVRESLTLQNQTVMIDQSDVIRLVDRSNMPKAVEFQDWLFDEVVPSILRTGSYGTPTQAPDLNDPQLLRTTLLAYAEKQIKLEERNNLWL